MRAALLVCLALALPAAATESCVACHGGAAERSYALSKHGVIARLDSGRPRQRAPHCADCHRFEAGAPAPAHYADPAQRELARQQAVAGCGGCHAPRYVSEQLAAARRGLAIGEMKQREAAAVVAAARQELPAAALPPFEALLATLRDDLRNLRLGLGHQSPDYQWWLGQAALDGDLLRIKGALGEARRAGAPAPAAAR